MSEEIPEGDFERGKRVFKLRCAHCHVAESPVNRLGPHLYGIVGRKAGSVDYYPYTAANKNKVCNSSLIGKPVQKFLEYSLEFTCIQLDISVKELPIGWKYFTIKIF